MSGIEKTNGVNCLTGARWSDQRHVADGANAVDRDRDHGADGRFRKGNTAARGTGHKRAVRALVPPHARKLYESMCREVGAAGGSLAAAHVADCVRHHFDAAELHAAARDAGIATERGLALLDKAQRSSELAMRASVAALEAARLLRHPRKRPRSVVPVGFEEPDK